jgi:hypothetical protein
MRSVERYQKPEPVRPAYLENWLPLLYLSQNEWRSVRDPKYADYREAEAIDMLRILLGTILSFYVISASAADPSCSTQATDKKLAGAAKKSFMQKCERDAKTSCDTAAGEKKLSGAAKTSFTSKCVKDAVGE